MPINYTPVSKEQAEALASPLVPSGPQPVTILARGHIGSRDTGFSVLTEQTTFQDGSQAISLVLFYDTPHKKRVLRTFINLTGQNADRGQAKLFELAEACGVLDKYQSGTLEIHHLVNKRVLAKIGHFKNQKGYLTEAVNGFAPCNDGGAPSTQAPAPVQEQDGPPASFDAMAPPPDDNIPF